MTRIVSYNFYQCPDCAQVHMKPNYGSISTYVPIDIRTKPTDIKTCQRCHSKHAVNEYIFKGEERDPSQEPNVFYEKEIRGYFAKLKALMLFRKYKANEPDVSLRNRYPRLQD